MESHRGVYKEYTNLTDAQLNDRLNKIKSELERFPKDDIKQLAILRSNLEQAKKEYKTNPSAENNKTKSDIASQIVNHSLFTLDSEAKALEHEISTRRDN